MSSTNNHKTWEICVHEASHFVFSRLIVKLDLDFPPCTKIEIQGTGWTGGTINGSWVEQNNTAEATKELKLLEQKTLDCKIAQIMFLLAGYASYKALIDPQRDLHPLSRVILPCPPCPSDIDKCQKIASHITGNSSIGKDRIGNWVINNDNLAFLEPIKASVSRILGHKSVKWGIRFCARELQRSKNLEGSALNRVTAIIDRTIKKYSIENEIKQLLQKY